MNEQHFDELLDSVRAMGRHMRGDSVQGLRVREFPELDVKAIRERTGLSKRAIKSVYHKTDSPI